MMNDQLIDRPVFICGHHRTGTSLLQNLLDGHPDLVVSTHESCFFSQFHGYANDLTPERELELVRKTVLRIWDSDHFYYKRYLTHLKIDVIEEIFWRNLRRVSHHHKHYLPAAILAYGEANGVLHDGTRYWVEKTPGDEFYAGQIFDWWAEARCIHVIRDPRALYASLKKRSGGITKPGKTAHRWMRSVQALEDNRHRYGSDRYLAVRYEDIVTDTQQVMQRIADFLGITYDNVLLIPNKAGGRKEWKGNSATGKKYAGISANALNRWRDAINKDDVAVLEILLGKEMEKYQYHPEATMSMRRKAKAVHQRMRALLSAGRKAINL